MKTKAILLSLALITSLSLSNEITEEMKNDEDKFCKETTTKIVPATKLINVCASFKASYPHVESNTNPNLAKYINAEISKVLQAKTNVKKRVLALIEDMPSEGEEKYSIDIKLLSLTSTSFSLESYLMYDDVYDERAGTRINNFDKKTGKKIKIDELFIKGYEQKFLEIVKKEYEKKGIEADDEDIEFKVAKNIGIAKDGLHLEYNMLEGMGTSRAVSLVIPYRLLKEIINTKSYLKDRR